MQERACQGQEQQVRKKKKQEQGEKGKASQPRAEERLMKKRVSQLTAAAFVAFALSVSPAHAAFGVVPGSFKTVALNQNGTIDTQAGSHPYEYVVSFEFNLEANQEPEGHVRDIDVELPPGLVGDPGAVPRCDRRQFEGIQPLCSPSTQVGTVHAELGILGTFEAPLYNVTPPYGSPALFGTSLVNFNVFEGTSVRTGTDYGIDVDTNNLPIKTVLAVQEIVWGVPAEESHDPARVCTVNGFLKEGCLSGAAPRPFLTLPTSCASPLQTGIRVDSFEAPEELLPAQTAFSQNAGGDPQSLFGCEGLVFEPSLVVAPDTASADTPAGLTAEVKVPSSGLQQVEGFSSADIKNTVVALPEDVAINPGQAAGLQACEPSEDAVGSDGPAECPNGSKVGEVRIRTPLLEEELAGDVYILGSDPPHLEILVSANDPVDGVYLKLVGHVELCESTGETIDGKLCAAPGQLITMFNETPPLPFSTFKLAFSGGAQAALTTPTRCGTYTTSSDFTPWSTPFESDLLASDTFAITTGPGGGPCPSDPLAFAPELIAGATTDQAGGFTNFSLLLRRGDAQQRIDGLQFKAPAGLTGELSRVPLCTNAQAEANACPEASKIGHTLVESGPGPYPLVVPEPGQPPAPIYLTGPYNGHGACTVGERECAPFGLSIVVPLHVGPFTLPTQRVRAKIEINALTAALTVTTNALPQEVAGVPTDLREVDSVIERPEFMINPTNCDPQEFSGTAYGTAPPGQSEPNETAHISSHFQVGACRSLEFAPKFSVSTSGKTSRSQGASLTATVSYPNVPQGSDADVSLAKVELPKQLPSRLTTLQKACTAKQFEANPAGCPAPSFIGHAVVHTPLLPVPLTGPAIFVSHGGEAFPSLEIVLQGDGVTVDLVGATFISKAGVTSTTFKTVPDAPFSSFELTLPEGPYSALAANGNLCAPTTTKTVKKKVTVNVHGHAKTETRKVKETVASSLMMPNEFVGQNGAVLKQDTKISVTGCPKTAVHKTKRRPTRSRRGR
jgi:hypothetical protein